MNVLPSSCDSICCQAHLKHLLDHLSVNTLNSFFNILLKYVQNILKYSVKYASVSIRRAKVRERDGVGVTKFVLAWF